jgi:sulfur carrier protein
MTLLVNGNQVELPNQVSTIAEVVTHFFPNKPVVIVEHNGEILDKELYEKQVVSDGDKVELVQFVGGG